jgi:hypothetical protein
LRQRLQPWWRNWYFLKPMLLPQPRSAEESQVWNNHQRDPRESGVILRSFLRRTDDNFRERWKIAASLVRGVWRRRAARLSYRNREKGNCHRKLQFSKFASTPYRSPTFCSRIWPIGHLLAQARSHLSPDEQSKFVLLDNSFRLRTKHRLLANSPISVNLQRIRR